VLLSHRTLPGADVIAAMDAAIGLGSFEADLVAVQARGIGLHGAPPPLRVAVPAVPPAGAHEHRPAPTLAAHDELPTGVGT
jgi:hypothetical protein